MTSAALAGSRNQSSAAEQNEEDDDEEAQWAEWSSLSEEQLYRRLAERAARRASKAVSHAASTKQQPNSESTGYIVTYPTE